MPRLSPTTGLALYNDCPRCFWLHFNKKIQRPRGIFPSLPGGMDLIIKDYFDNYRGSLPKELNGKIDGVLMDDLATLNKWRNWRSGLTYHSDKLDADLFGALDDCLVDGKTYIPLDYKTRGSAPKDGDSEKYYQTQLDTYTLLLKENGYPTGDHAYLVYYYPDTHHKNNSVRFNIEPVRVRTDPARAMRLFTEAVKTLSGPVPESSDNCEYCAWLSARINHEK